MKYSLQGLIMGPGIVALIVALKAFCGTEGACFADRFAAPIFLPLTSLYKMSGGSPVIYEYDLLLTFGYWALLGFLLGLILDLYTRQSQY